MLTCSSPMSHQKKTYSSPGKGQTRNTIRKFRVCIFVLNNFSVEEYQCILESREHLSKLVFQSEVGANGTPHLQGMAQSAIQKPISGWKSLFMCNRIHIEQCKNIQASRNYCKKEDTWDGRIRFEMWNNEIISNINANLITDQLVIYSEPRDIIDWHNKMIYKEGEEIYMEKAKSNFLKLISNDFNKWLFSQHILKLELEEEISQ